MKFWLINQLFNQHSFVAAAQHASVARGVLFWMCVVFLQAFRWVSAPHTAEQAHTVPKMKPL